MENVPSKGTTLEQIRDSKPFSKLKDKVPLNFPKEQKNIFQEMLHQTWDKKSLVEHYLTELSAIDQTKVFDLQEHIQSEFRRIKGSNDHNIEIGDLPVIEHLSQQGIKFQYIITLNEEGTLNQNFGDFEKINTDNIDAKAITVLTPVRKFWK